MYKETKIPKFILISHVDTYYWKMEILLQLRRTVGMINLLLITPDFRQGTKLKARNISWTTGVGKYLLLRLIPPRTTTRWRARSLPRNRGWELVWASRPSPPWRTTLGWPLPWKIWCMCLSVRSLRRRNKVIVFLFMGANVKGLSYSRRLMGT